MGKTKLTRAQGDALRKAVKEIGKEEVIRAWALKDDRYSVLKEITGVCLLDALTYGWEEICPVKELKDAFIRRRQFEGFEKTPFFNWCAGVVAALDATGQRIEGINA